MNECFLPDNYREMAQTQTTEEYRNNHYTHSAFARNQIQWYIDRIREILDEMPFPCSDTLDDKQKRRVRILQKKRDNQLAALNLSEIIIKEDVNKLLNAMSGSVNHKWDDYNLGEIVGFQSDTIKCSEDLIPLPIQSLYYTVILTYGYLVNHAISAVILKYKVISLFEDNPQTIEVFFENKLKPFEDSLSQLTKDFYLHDNREKNHHDTTNKHIDRFYRAVRRNKLTQKECAEIIWNTRIIFGMKRQNYLKDHDLPCISEYYHYHVAEKKSIEREIQRWDKMCNERRETKICPPDGYSREKNYAGFKDWIEKIEEDKYNIWKDDLIAKLRIKAKTNGIKHILEAEDEENPQEEIKAYQDRHEKSLDHLINHTTRR